MHQLAIVCSVGIDSRTELERIARECGLSPGDVVLTGFVPETDLVALYRSCKAFVFPSWHEGFGLPALEAMSCGAAVIAANTSSLPEVVGNEDALFDPRNIDSIAEKIARVLEDHEYREKLIRHGEAQCKKFSWDDSAKRAIWACEVMYTRVTKTRSLAGTLAKRPSLAYVSPLPPCQSGIADYSAVLLPQLARFYQIEVIVAQAEIADPWIKANCAVRDVEWFQEHASRYDRILYNVGNSSYHSHMYDLCGEFPGCIVLHDFFLGNALSQIDDCDSSSNVWTQALYESHGYSALAYRFNQKRCPTPPIDIPQIG